MYIYNICNIYFNLYKKELEENQNTYYSTYESITYYLIKIK